MFLASFLNLLALRVVLCNFVDFVNLMSRIDEKIVSIPNYNDSVLPADLENS